MQAAVVALVHRVPGEREDRLRAPDGIEVKAACADVRDVPVGTAIGRCQNAPLAAVRLLARPVIFGE
jgi:hypothetical protein